MNSQRIGQTRGRINNLAVYKWLQLVRSKLGPGFKMVGSIAFFKRNILYIFYAFKKDKYKFNDRFIFFPYTTKVCGEKKYLIFEIYKKYYNSLPFKKFKY